MNQKKEYPLLILIYGKNGYKNITTGIVEESIQSSAQAQVKKWQKDYSNDNKTLQFVENKNIGSSYTLSAILRRRIVEKRRILEVCALLVDHNAVPLGKTDLTKLLEQKIISYIDKTNEDLHIALEVKDAQPTEVEQQNLSENMINNASSNGVPSNRISKYTYVLALLVMCLVFVFVFVLSSLFNSNELKPIKKDSWTDLISKKLFLEKSSETLSNAQRKLWIELCDDLLIGKIQDRYQVVSDEVSNIDKLQKIFNETPPTVEEIKLNYSVPEIDFGRYRSKFNETKFRVIKLNYDQLKEKSSELISHYEEIYNVYNKSQEKMSFTPKTGHDYEELYELLENLKKFPLLEKKYSQKLEAKITEIKAEDVITFYHDGSKNKRKITSWSDVGNIKLVSEKRKLDLEVDSISKAPPGNYTLSIRKHNGYYFDRYGYSDGQQKKIKENLEKWEIPVFFSENQKINIYLKPEIYKTTFSINIGKKSYANDEIATVKVNGKLKFDEEFEFNEKISFEVDIKNTKCYEFDYWSIPPSSIKDIKGELEIKSQLEISCILKKTKSYKSWYNKLQQLETQWIDESLKLYKNRKNLTSFIGGATKLWGAQNFFSIPSYEKVLKIEKIADEEEKRVCNVIFYLIDAKDKYEKIAHLEKKIKENNEKKFDVHTQKECFNSFFSLVSELDKLVTIIDNSEVEVTNQFHCHVSDSTKQSEKFKNVIPNLLKQDQSNISHEIFRKDNYNGFMLQSKCILANLNQLKNVKKEPLEWEYHKAIGVGSPCKRTVTLTNDLSMMKVDYSESGHSIFSFYCERISMNLDFDKIQFKSETLKREK